LLLAAILVEELRLVVMLTQCTQNFAALMCVLIRTLLLQKKRFCSLRRSLVPLDNGSRESFSSSVDRKWEYCSLRLRSERQLAKGASSVDDGERV